MQVWMLAHGLGFYWEWRKKWPPILIFTVLVLRSPKIQNKITFVRIVHSIPNTAVRTSPSLQMKTERWTRKTSISLVLMFSNIAIVLSLKTASPRIESVHFNVLPFWFTKTVWFYTISNGIKVLQNKGIFIQVYH